MPLAQTPQRTSLPPALKAFAQTAIVLTLTCVAAMTLCRTVLHLPNVPYGVISKDSADDFVDIRMFDWRLPSLHSAAFFSRDPAAGDHFLYPAPDALFYAALRPFGDAKVAVFLGVASFLMAAGAVMFALLLIRHGIRRSSAIGFTVACLLTSYPFFFELNRANVEIFVWALSLAGIIAILRDKLWWAATLIGMAGACKLYPFVYAGLLVTRRKYLHAAYAAAVGAVLTVFSYWFVGGSLRTGREGIARGLAEFTDVYVLRRRAGEIDLDHSLFGFFKRLLPFEPTYDFLNHALHWYLPIAAAVALALFILRAWKLPVINQVLLLTVAGIVLPPVSYDYTLLHLYTPFVLVAVFAVDAWRRHERSPRGLWPVIACFAVLLTTQTEIIFHGARLEGAIKCLTLLLLAATALLVPMPMEAAAIFARRARAEEGLA